MGSIRWEKNVEIGGVGDESMRVGLKCKWHTHSRGVDLVEFERTRSLENEVEDCVLHQHVAHLDVGYSGVDELTEVQG